MSCKGTLFLISAPSGAGKTTLVTGLIQRLGQEHSLERVVTYTSRAPRRDERDGYDYHFVSEEDFERRAQQGFFIEWSSVYGAYYGSPRNELAKLDRGISLCMILDLQGIKEVMSFFPSISIWIAPPTMRDLQKRLAQRGSEGLDDTVFRLNLAQDELTEVADQNIFDYTIVNDDLEVASNELQAIVLREMEKTKKSLGQPAFVYASRMRKV